MPTWLPLDQFMHSVRPKPESEWINGTFQINADIQQLRVQCTLSERNEHVVEEACARLVHCYLEQFEYSEDQKDLVNDYIQQAAVDCQNRGWSVRFFDAEGIFRGRWDPAFGGWKRLTAFEADEGFVGGPLPDGLWHYVIRITSPALTGASIRIDLEVNGESDAPPDFVPFDLSCQLVLQPSEPRWYAGELVESTARSGGCFGVQATVEAYQQLGYSFLGIADEDMQPLSALQRQPQLGLIRGQVLPAPAGHWNALGLSRYLHWHRDGVILPVDELIYKIHAQGGLVMKMNPFAPREVDISSVQPEIPSQHIQEIAWEHVDLLQIWEGFWKQRFLEIQKAFELWDELLNRDIRTVGVCGKGADIEVNARNVETLPKLLVYSEGPSEEALLTAVKLGKCYATVEPGIDFWIESEYGGILSGEELQLPDGEVITLRLDVTGAGERCFFRIKTNDGLFCEMPLIARKDPVQMKFTDYAEPKVRWYRVELYRYGRPVDQLLAFSNPLYVRGLYSTSFL